MTLTSQYDTRLPLIRNNFWHGKLMGVQEFQRDQQYLLSLQRTLSRLTVGAGVLCGLGVTPEGAGLRVSGGAALDGAGRLVVVPRPVAIDDITRWVCPPPPTGKPDPGTYELCLLHHECPTDPAPALITDCDTRIECLPGAIEERYRLELRLRDEAECEDVCERCRDVIEPGRDCPVGDDCVQLALISWDGEEIVSISMEQRDEVPSNRDLYEWQRCQREHCQASAVRAPRLVEVWPPPGTTLAREGSPSEWSTWRLRPRIELSFDRPVNEDRIDDTRDWIRAWAVANDAANGNQVVSERLDLTYVKDRPTCCCGVAGTILDVDSRSLGRLATLAGQVGGRIAVVVQAFSDSETGPLGAGSVALPAQLQHAGTTLTVAQLDELWAANTLPQMDIDAIRADPSPPCFTDGFDGGRLHSVFYIDAGATELRLTAVHPYNGARAAGADLPSIQVSFARPIQQPGDDWLLDTTNPWLRAWFVPGSGPVEQLSIDAARIVDRPQIADLFAGEFDATLRQELAGTIEYQLSTPVATSGRVLVVSRSPVGANSVGSFGGTCLGRDHLSDLWNGTINQAELYAANASIGTAIAAGRSVRRVDPLDLCMGDELMTMIYEPPPTTHGNSKCGPGCGCGSCCGLEACAWAGDQALTGLERTRFYPRQIVTPDDLTQDQHYFQDKLRRHNRLLHGWGLVCGLVVERCAGSEPGIEDPCKVRVTSGYALDPYGNEIVVSKPVVVDLCKEDMMGTLACLPYDDPWCRPVETSRTGTYYLAIRFCERAVKPVHAPTGCSCKDASCENSRYRDEYELSLLPELPDHYDAPCEQVSDFCAGVDECPACPTSGWIVLATVTMSGSAIDALSDENRRHALSLARYCLDCSRVPKHFSTYARFGTKKRLLGVATSTPDAMVKLHAVIDGTLTEVEIPVAEADLRGKTASELAAAWAGVPLFDTDDLSTPVFDASWLLAHSPMKGPWIVESADDLSARLGYPVINTKAYPQDRKVLEDLLDSRGRKHLHENLLDNIDRLDELDLDMLTGISKDTAGVLQQIGIRSVADLTTVDLQNPRIPDAVRGRLIPIRDALTRARA